MTDSCDPMECSLPGSSVHGISQARLLEWVAISSSNGSSRPRDQICISCDSCIAGGFFIPWAIKEAPRWHFSHQNSISCFKKGQEDPVLSSNKILCTSTDNKEPLQLWTQSSPINFLKTTLLNFLFIVVQWLSHVWFFAIPWDAACQASLSFTVSWSMLQFMSVVSVMSLVKVSFCIFGLAYDSPGQVFKLQFLCYSQINSTCW